MGTSSTAQTYAAASIVDRPCATMQNQKTGRRAAKKQRPRLGCVMQSCTHHTRAPAFVLSFAGPGRDSCHWCGAYVKSCYNTGLPCVSQEPIDEKKACEGNTEEINRFSYMEDIKGIKCCRQLCDETCGCTAIDYYARTMWCSLYKKQCKVAYKSIDWASSHRRTLSPKKSAPPTGEGSKTIPSPPSGKETMQVNFKLVEQNRKDSKDRKESAARAAVDEITRHAAEDGHGHAGNGMKKPSRWKLRQTEKQDKPE